MCRSVQQVYEIFFRIFNIIVVCNCFRNLSTLFSLHHDIFAQNHLRNIDQDITLYPLQLSPPKAITPLDIRHTINQLPPRKKDII